MKKLMNSYYQMLLVVCATAMFFSCNDKQWDDHNRFSDHEIAANLLEAIKENPLCCQFYQAVAIAGYGDLLSQANVFTVFVPTNEAWKDVNMNDSATVQAMVSYHITCGKLTSFHSQLFQPLQMVNTKMVKYNGETQTFNGAKITSADHIAGNGVFHITDKLMDLKKNIWDYVSEMDNFQQTQYIRSLNHKVMDLERSVQTGVNSVGRPVYDTIWMNVNNFLEKVPLDNEKEVLTYLVVKNEGFDKLFNKYRSCFTDVTDMATDSLARFNICQDFVFRGAVDITQYDTLTNIFGVKVPVKSVEIEESFEASNGMIYVINESNILLKEKFKPVFIEGEDFIRSANSTYVFIRFKRWASGERDMFLSSSNRQTNIFYTIDEFGHESSYTTTSKLFQLTSAEHGGNIRANVQNFWVEYKADVYSLDYEIQYVAYDDVQGHFDISEPAFRLCQKLFVSMPGRPVLRKGSVNEQILNNYLGDNICFVSQDTAGIHKQRTMRQWTLDISGNRPQLIVAPMNTPDAATMSVDRVGELTLWLCNTALSTTSNEQGMLFLDYIKLTPKLPEE